MPQIEDFVIQKLTLAANHPELGPLLIRVSNSQIKITGDTTQWVLTVPTTSLFESVTDVLAYIDLNEWIEQPLCPECNWLASQTDTQTMLNSDEPTKYWHRCRNGHEWEGA